MRLGDQEPAGYNTEAAGLARALARILLTPPPAQLPPAECDRLLADRRDVLTSLAGLHRSLVPDAQQTQAAADVADLERDPVGTLGVLLHRHPRGPASRRSPAERSTDAPATPAGQAWRETATRALTTAAAAERLDPRWYREPAAAWAAVADLAALGEAFAVADSDLAAVVPGHPAARGEGSGLRTAAAHCARLATGGPLASIPENLAAPALRYPTPVTAPAQLAGAQRRVTAMIDGTRTAPAPTLLAQLAVGQARAHLAAARVLRTATHPGLGHESPNPPNADRLLAAAAALNTRAAGYTDLAEACGPVRGLPPGSGLRAVQQTGEILRTLTRLQETVTPERAATAAPHLLAFAGQGLELAAALDRAVRRGVAADYLVPNPRNERKAPGWVPARLDNPPRLLQATSRAATAEPGITAAVTDATRGHRGTAAAARAGAARAADELRHALHLRAAGRPTRPSPTPTARPAAAPARRH